MALKQETVPAAGLLGDRYRHEGGPSLATEDFDDEDEFEDATEENTINTMDLHTAFHDCETAIKKFFNNDIEGALNVMKPWSYSSLYHSLGICIFEFIPAMLTFDHDQINRTLEAVKKCITICNQHRRVSTFVESIGTMIKKPNYSTYSDIEAHSELCYAEVLLLQACMTIMEGEDLTALIKGTMKIRSCYSSYKDCSKILEKKRQWLSEDSKVHFESGVRTGLAAFNLIISHLPPKIISLLEFVGFSGNKNFALCELKSGAQSPGLRSILCKLTFLGYNLVICHFIGAEADLPMCNDILQRELQIYPEGVWFLLFKGRYELLEGRFESAISMYNRAIDSQDIWRQFKHVCYWEIMWVHGLLMEWQQASVYTDMLLEQNSWSRTIYSYVKAAMLLQHNAVTNSEVKVEINTLLKKTVQYKQRIAGKSLPMEKFMIRRCARYEAQGKRLILPAVELLCLWNMFHILAKNTVAAQAILKLIETTRNAHETGNRQWMAGYESDNMALMRYLHGSCLAAMGLPRMALDILDSVFSYKSTIKEDTFILPYTLFEIAMCHHNLGNTDLALQFLLDARKKFSGYSLESRLHFRIHSKMQILKEHSPIHVESESYNQIVNN